MAVALQPAFPPLGLPQPDGAASGGMGPRLRQVRGLRRLPLHELVPRLAELRADEAGPVRKLVAE